MEDMKDIEDKENNDNQVEITQGFIAEGTTCESCEKIIKKQALKVDGVKKVEFDYSKETGKVTFDPKKTDIDAILDSIEEKGYTCFLLKESSPETKKKPKTSIEITGWIISIIGIILIGYFLLQMADGINMPQISQNMGYGLLFIVGLLTGFHCVSMCGGFVVSYTTKHAQEGKNTHKAHMMYGLGKTLSYTIIGAIFGLVGSIIAFTPMMRGIAGILAGTFLVLFGLKMLNIFPILRKIQFRTPRFVARFVGIESTKHSSPLVIGLLNGLMIACGPLQAIYIMAAGTGSMIEGAKLLFIFGLGTLPVMLGFGYFASFISSKMTHKILRFSGAVVIILGFAMFNNGLVLTGSGFDFKSIVDVVSGSASITGSVIGTDSGSNIQLKDGYQEIRMKVTRYGWEPDKFVLKKDVPVKWIIDGVEINGCNNAIQVPDYNLEFKVQKGEQVIEFTPTKSGTIRWSCWMGMIPGTFIVSDDIDLGNTEQVQEKLNSVTVPAGGSCGGGGSGGCGCGR